jgi:putative transposase
MIDPGHPRLSIVRQCELASISRSSFYRKPTAESEETLRLMRLIDEQFLETPWYGSRQMARHLRRNGWCVGRHRVRRLMTKMGLAPIYQRPKTSEPHPQHRTWPYLLRHLTIDRPNQVWCAANLVSTKTGEPIATLSADDPAGFGLGMGCKTFGSLRRKSRLSDTVLVDC